MNIMEGCLESTKARARGAIRTAVLVGAWVVSCQDFGTTWELSGGDGRLVGQEENHEAEANDCGHR